jgi:lysophospholipase L1-like esterase
MIKRAFLVLGLLAVQCPPASGAGQTIVVIGDSLSGGYGRDPEQSWVALLENHLEEQAYGDEVVNSSIAGGTSAVGLVALVECLMHGIQLSPELMRADRVHPRPTDQRTMVENVSAVLSELL